MLAASDSFAQPTLSEAAQILHVYALLERLGGVYGDGTIEGVELTRDGRAQSCFASPEHRTAWQQRLADARFGPSRARRREAGEIDTILPVRPTDRYGFFLTDGTASLHGTPDLQDSRTVLLEASAYASGLKAQPVASTSSARPVKAILASAASPDADELERESRRIAKWQGMMRRATAQSGATHWQLAPDLLSSQSGIRKVRLTLYDIILGQRLRFWQLRKRIYKGVPDRWRAAVWPAIACLIPNNPRISVTGQSNYSKLLYLTQTRYCRNAY